MAQIGMLGLGTMGAALALNIAEKGYSVAAYNRSSGATERLMARAGDLAPRITPCDSLPALADAIEPPRSVIMLVPAGAPVDDTIPPLREVLGLDGLIIDAGNANFHDTVRRAKAASAAGARFLGIGVSGGEDGARHGPSIMGGGDKSAWEDVAPILEAISAKFKGQPCAAWFGTDGAGHFVKTVHNGIEYADMQMIAEVYGLMHNGLRLSAAEISDTFGRWNEGLLASYLIEISSEVAGATDSKTGKPILDVILDRAGQKGTGRWTAIEALHLAAPATTIEAAVAARNVSARLEERQMGGEIFGANIEALTRTDGLVDDLERALIAGKIACYAQGFGLLEQASNAFGWKLPLPKVAEVWRAGCIIRSDMLDDMAAALDEAPGRNLMFGPTFSAHLQTCQSSLRRVLSEATLSGQSVPALSAALAYFDGMRVTRGDANMIQGLRDFFGRHGFERLDAPGQHHGPWAES
ncbi:MAG: NADP-dependent phosphogluconate dehydrogenase [Pseudomonadota bacterium]